MVTKYKYSILKYIFLIWLTSILVCDRTSTISSSRLFSFFIDWTVRILVSVSTKNKYSILK